MRAFTPRSIAALEPRIRELSRGLLDPLIERGHFDVVAEYATLLPTLVIAEMIGIPIADRPRFVRWSDVIVRLSYSVTGGDVAAQAIAAHAEMKAEVRPYLAGLVAERRRAPVDDLLGRLAIAEVDGERLHDEDLLGFFQLLLAAGTETTTNLISNAMICLADHPDQLAKLRATPHLLPSAIEEVVRFRSPGQIMFRQTLRDVELAGQRIPADSFVLAMIGSANRDPKYFLEPNRFDIARDPNPHIAFGHGIHFCLGAPLSRLEGRVALGDLLAGMASWELASDEPWSPRNALHVHGPTRLLIRLRA